MSSLLQIGAADASVQHYCPNPARSAHKSTEPPDRTMPSKRHFRGPCVVFILICRSVPEAFRREIAEKRAERRTSHGTRRARGLVCILLSNAACTHVAPFAS